MTDTFVLRRIDVLLLDLVQQLAADYPDLPVSLVARCVDAARCVVRSGSDDEAVEQLAALERVVRNDLGLIVASMAGPASPAHLPAAGS